MKTEIYQNRLYPYFKSVTVRLALSFLLATSLCHLAGAQTFHLLKDLNPYTDANPVNVNYTYNNYSFNFRNEYAVLNGINYFAADDGVHGSGLWRSDGTAAGTWQVKDSIAPTAISVFNGKLYFNGTGVAGLWVSDGTTAGTKPVLSAMPAGLSSFSPSNFSELNGTVFFVITGHYQNDQLWKTDGTEAGTVLVKDFYDPVYINAGLYLSYFTAIDNKLYFSVDSYNSNFQSDATLWATDGTDAGTYAISNNVYDPGQITPVDINGTTYIYFSAVPYPSGPRTLYRTTGMAGNVGVAAGFNAEILYDFNSENLINKSGVLYFVGRSNSIYQGLYKFDIAAANGVQAIKIASSTGANGGLSYIQNLTDINGTLFFSFYDAALSKNQLWKSDGTSLGNVLLLDNVYTYNLVNAGGICYFIAFEKVNGSELWKSDGTVNGTGLVKDIHPGAVGANPYSLTYSNGKLLFSAQDAGHGSELWRSDGTAGGTALVKDINQTTTASSSPASLIPLNGNLMFTAFDNTTGQFNTLYKSDGSTAGTYVLSDTVFPQSYSNFALVNNSLAYFWGNTLSGKQGLYKTNATTAGTKLVKNFESAGFSITSVLSTNNLGYFYGYNRSTATYELWRTDGTDANTYVIKNDFNGYIYSTNFIKVGNTLFFKDGNSLWKTDGSIAGTVLVKTFAGIASDFCSFNDKLFFSAYTGSGYTLWKSDGTASGTVEVSANVTFPTNFMVSNSKLFFIAIGNAGVYGNVGQELFTTDGTVNGTLLVKDIHPGLTGTYIYKPIDVAGTLYFFTDLTLWKSDGTSAGTKMISNVDSNGVGNPQYPYSVAACGGKLFFALFNKLWESDGTQAGTHTVTDNIFPGVSISDYSANLTSVGNKLFFSAYDYAHGQEVYEGEITALPVTLLSFTGALQKTDGWLNWSTASEQNNNYFHLQRSTNGVGFKDIVTIKGAGTTNTKTDYSYTDKNITALGKDKIYYRLQQVDADGTATLSNIVVLDIAKQTRFFVGPNPVQGVINLFSSTAVQNAGVNLLDMNGRLIYANRKNLSPGQPMQIESASLAKGLYVLKIENAGTISEIKVIKN